VIGNLLIWGKNGPPHFHGDCRNVPWAPKFEHGSAVSPDCLSIFYLAYNSREVIFTAYSGGARDGQA